MKNNITETAFKIRNFVIVVFFLIISAICSAEGSKENDTQTVQQTQQQTQRQTQQHTAYWTGDGGNGIRLAVLEPTSRGLSASENWMPSMIQSSITGDFQKFSAMTIIDRQNLEKIINEQKQSLSGNYSDNDYIRIGKLTNARYVLTGSITKTASAFMLELAVTDVESGERKASYPPKAVSPFALENMSAVKEATAELLRQLGVQLTNAGLQELNSTSNAAQVKAETALAKGIEAQRQGTTVEALSYFIQASNYNSGLTEAVSRMNNISADISSGNIGQDTRNDIAWRRDWVKRLQETETFFANSLKEPQPFYIVYSTDIRQGKIDYQKETIDLTIWMGFYPDYVWAENINEVINAVKRGLQTTGRAQVWELDWPAKSINNPSPFVTQTKNSTSSVVVEIINSEGRSIGRQTVRSPYGFESRSAVITPSWQWEGDVAFTAVNANLITDKLTIKITSIDGIAAETASRQKNISIMPLTEWEFLLKTLPSTRRNIELVRQHQRADDLRKLADEQLKNGNAYLAITNYTEAIRLNPNDAMAYMGRGNAYSEIENYDKAIADYTQAIRLNPNYADAYFNRGGIYLGGTGDYDKAIADYTQAIRLKPNDADAYFNRATAYGLLKDYNKAIADLTEVIRIKPNDEAYYGRGLMYAVMNNRSKAKADYEAAYRLNPNDANIRDAYIRSRGW